MGTFEFMQKNYESVKELRKSWELDPFNIQARNDYIVALEIEYEFLYKCMEILNGTDNK